MRDKYVETKNELNLHIRNNTRMKPSSKKLLKLEKDEEKEEEFENLEAR